MKQTSIEDEPRPFLEHLEDLRKTLIRSLCTIAVATAVVIPFVPVVVRFLQRPLEGITADPGKFLASLDVTGAFSVAVQIAFWSGLVIASPFLLLFVFGFVMPGLTPRERSAVRVASVLAIFLFAAGVCLGYFMTLPVALRFMFGLHGWLGIEAKWTITSYVAFTTQLLVGFGLAFELPALVLALGYLGILSSAMLRDKRRHAIVIILFISMILTPSDVFSMVIMAIPLIVLYEACVWITWHVERKRRRDAG